MLSGWKHYRKITIDNTKIDADLTWFPITLFLGSSVGLTSADVTSIFDEVGDNPQKIAITKDDGETQIYAEVEQWDAVNKKAVLHVSKSDLTLSSSADTILYFYYDGSHADNTDYIGITPGSAPATNVWDSNFKMVLHLKETGTDIRKDSTANHNDGTPYNGVAGADGKIDGANSFDGSDDYIRRATFSGTPQSYITIEAWIKTASTDGEYLVQINRSSSNTQNEGAFVINPDGTLSFWDYGSGYGFAYTQNSTGTVNSNTWRYVSFVKNGTNGQYYIDGSPDASPTASKDVAYGSNDFVVGSNYRDSNFFFNGLIDELRISDINRSSAWNKASYNSGNDSLVSWGEEKTIGGNAIFFGTNF